MQCGADLTDTGQRDMFAPDQEPKARTTDPLPSHVAAAEAEAKGAARGHRARIFEAIMNHPARRGRELAQLTGLEAYAVSKRLTELHRRGLIEPGMIKDGRARRWFATDKGLKAWEERGA
jgi:DNA-binding MarR family transcriptional regulator